MAKALSSTSLTMGPAAASLLGVGLGLLALAIAHILSELSGSFKDAMQALGNVWIPGAAGIGPYSGKETVGLLAWLISWGLLHAVLRKREVSLVVAGILTLILIGVATTLLWPLVTALFIHH